MKFLKKFIQRLLRSRSQSHEIKKWLSLDGGQDGVNEGLLAQSHQPNGLATLNKLKAKRQPVVDVDYLRAIHFWKLGQMSAVQESLKEELRYFPENPRAQKLQQKLFGEKKETGSDTIDPRCQHICKTVSAYTMMGRARLENIYKQVTGLCQRGVTGHFVECGVAAGGSSALLAAVIQDHAEDDRRVFSFDTFEGMPDPTGEDTHQGIQAQDTGWGAGTCSASEQSLLEVCGKLNVSHLIMPVKGLFADTLPHWVERIGPIAFLHVDGDWYSSTIDVLENMFDSVVPGGVIQFDDYGYWDGCKKAVHEFMARRGLNPELHKIDSTGVWMIKS